MTNITHIVYGKLISKPNKLGIDAYTKNGVKTILKDNEVIKTITKERLFNDQVELTHISNYKNNKLVGADMLRKDFDEDGCLFSAVYSKHNDSGRSVNFFMRNENGRFIQFKQSADEFFQDIIKFLSNIK